MHNIETMQEPLKTGLTPQQQQEMRLWILSGGKRGKQHSNILYSWYDPNDPSINGHSTFIEFSKTKKYQEMYGIPEKGLIHESGGNIGKNISSHTKELVELGPGNNKIVEYFDDLGIKENIKNKLVYCPSDVAKSAIDDGLAEAEELKIKSGLPLLGDWNNPVIFSQLDVPLYLCFGGGFVNDFNSIADRIRFMGGNNYIHSGKLYFTYYPSPDKSLLTLEAYKEEIQRIKASYGDKGTKDNPNPFYNAESREKSTEMILKPFEALGFEREYLELDVEREEGTPSKVAIGARVIADHTLIQGDEKITLKKGKFLKLIDSPRPTEEEIKKEIIRGGGTINNIFHGKEGGRGVLVGLPRKKISEKTLKRAKNIGGILAISVLTFLGLGEYNKYSKFNSARDYALKELSYKNIEHPSVYKIDSNTSHRLIGMKTNFNDSEETRLERLEFLTNTLYDMMLTEYKTYKFPSKNIVKSAIMRLIPDHTEYFTHTSGPDTEYFEFMNTILMPHFFRSFGNPDNVKLYDWLNSEYKELIEITRNSDKKFRLDKLENTQKTSHSGIDFRQYVVKNLGEMYIPNYNNAISSDENIIPMKKIKLGKITFNKYVRTSYKGGNFIPGEEFLVSGDDKNGYSITNARMLLDYVDEKGYVPNLANKIIKLIDPTTELDDNAVVLNSIKQHFISMNKQGYDFSWMVQGNHEKEIKNYIVGFLLEDNSISETTKLAIKNSSLNKSGFNYKQGFEKIFDHLDTYYGHHYPNMSGERDSIGARNFFYQVVLSDYFSRINSPRGRYDNPLIPQNINKTLSRRTENLKDFGYNLEKNTRVKYSLRELFNNYDQYKGKDVRKANKISIDLNDLYLGSIVFTSDGRGWVLQGNIFPIGGFELTKKNSYETIKKKLPELFEQFSEEQFKRKFSELENRETRLIKERVMKYIEKTFLKPSYEAAYEVAKDFNAQGKL